jgi:hypothetical protein
VRPWHPQTVVGGTDSDMVLLARAGIRYLLGEPRTEWAWRDDGMRVQSGRGQDDHNHAGRPPLPLKWVGRGWLGGSMQAGIKVSAAAARLGCEH